MEKKIKHKSVLLQEVVNVLEPKPGEVFIDSTIGFGGHAVAILDRISQTGRLLGIDQDEEALAWNEKNLKPKYSNLTLKKANFSAINEIAKKEGFVGVNGILADIGISSHQIDMAERGFSFKKAGPLDMRMDKSQKVSAEEVINTYSEHDLTQIFSKYGEERLSKTIAREIVTERRNKPFKSTLELTELIGVIYEKRGLKSFKIHPATKVFQALRIEVNNELGNLEKFLPEALSLLKKGGKLAVITFHSLEDRTVKSFFQKEVKGCICPSDYPICKCDHEPRIKIITKKPILPNKEEINKNPRSRSAKLRVAEKI